MREKCENVQCKSFSHFLTKNIGIFQILAFEILTNDVISFEQLDPGHSYSTVNFEIKKYEHCGSEMERSQKKCT